MIAHCSFIFRQAALHLDFSSIYEPAAASPATIKFLAQESTFGKLVQHSKSELKLEGDLGMSIPYLAPPATQFHTWGLDLRVFMPDP